jgi:hypothetical protein
METCPNCGKQTTFTSHELDEFDNDDGYHISYWLTCDLCNSITSNAELEKINTDGAY